MVWVTQTGNQEQDQYTKKIYQFLIGMMGIVCGVAVILFTLYH